MIVFMNHTHSIGFKGKGMNYRYIGFLLLVFSKISFAEEIIVYRWVDEKSIVHFSQHQPPHNNYTELTMAAISSKLNSSSAASALAVEKAQEQARTKSEDYNEKCETAKSNLSTLTEFQKVQYTDRHGEVQVLSDDEKELQLGINTKQVEVYCKDL